MLLLRLHTCSNALQPLLSQYCNICSSASHTNSGASDEVLYGRAGTLLGALLLRQQLGPQAVPEGAVRALAQAMLQSGRYVVHSNNELRAGHSLPWGPAAAMKPLQQFGCHTLRVPVQMHKHLPCLKSQTQQQYSVCVCTL